jgi:hypothetical protein
LVKFFGEINGDLTKNTVVYAEKLIITLFFMNMTIFTQKSTKI